MHICLGSASHQNGSIKYYEWGETHGRHQKPSYTQWQIFGFLVWNVFWVCIMLDMPALTPQWKIKQIKVLYTLYSSDFFQSYSWPWNFIHFKMSQAILCITFDPCRWTLKKLKMASRHAPSTDKHNLLGNKHDRHNVSHERALFRHCCSRQVQFSWVNVEDTWLTSSYFELWAVCNPSGCFEALHVMIWAEEESNILQGGNSKTPPCCYLFIFQYHHPQGFCSLLMPLTDLPF